MVKGTTSTGFNFEIDPDVVKDMEVIELIADVAEDGSKMPKMLVAILGKDQKTSLYNHVRNDAGRVLFDDVNKEMEEIFESLSKDAATKN